MHLVTLPRWEVKALIAFLDHYVEEVGRGEFSELLQKLRYMVAKTTATEVSESFTPAEKRQIYIALGEMQYSLRKR